MNKVHYGDKLFFVFRFDVDALHRLHAALKLGEHVQLENRSKVPTMETLVIVLTRLR